MSVRLPLSEAIYPRKCLDEAIAAYAGLCSVEVSEVSSKACIIEITPYVGSEPEGERVAHEFMNYLLDLSLENRLGISQR
jgi:hypothetical protein